MAFQIVSGEKMEHHLKKVFGKNFKSEATKATEKYIKPDERIDRSKVQQMPPPIVRNQKENEMGRDIDRPQIP